MQIELCIHTSQTLTASALITDVQSCNLIFINADCFDHSVAILCGAFPALYRHLTVTGICKTALHFLSSLLWQVPQHFKCCLAPQGLPTGFPYSGGHRGSRFAQSSTVAAGSSDPTLQSLSLATHSPFSRFRSNKKQVCAKEAHIKQIWEVFCETNSLVKRTSTGTRATPACLHNAHWELITSWTYGSCSAQSQLGIRLGSELTLSVASVAPAQKPIQLHLDKLHSEAASREEHLPKAALASQVPSIQWSPVPLQSWGPYQSLL